jgi:hypothetical protein
MPTLSLDKKELAALKTKGLRCDSRQNIADKRVKGNLFMAKEFRTTPGCAKE